MTRTVLLRLKSGQLITSQICEFCYSYDYYYNVTLYFALTKEIWNCSTFYL